MNDAFCRGCLKTEGKKSLYEECNGGILSTQFLECTGVNVIRDSTVPHKLCNMCYDKLQDSHSFRLMCIRSDDIIKKHYDKVVSDKSVDTSHSKELFCTPSHVGSEDSDKIEEEINISNEKTTLLVKDKNIQELHFLDDFQFVYKPKQKRKNRLTKHMCEVCGYCANDAYTLKVHSNTHIETTEKTHACHICHKKFATPISLKCHISRHNTSNSLMCEECGLRFSSAAHLSAHKRSTHSGLRPYACGLCPRTFALRSNLNVHQKIHAGIRPHKCQTCGKCFTTTSDLKGHIRSHSGEKPHVCDVCHKSFSLRSNLNVHLRIHHQNNTLFKCTQCDGSFTSKASLKSHQKTHSGVRLHVCTICSARFTHSNTLRSHRTVHTGQRDHACTQCDKKFSRASILKTHMKKHDKQCFSYTLTSNENNVNIIENDNQICAEYKIQNSNINANLCKDDKNSNNSSNSQEFKSNNTFVSTLKMNQPLTKICKLNSTNGSTTSTRNATVIETAKKADECIYSNKQKTVVVAEQMYNVRLGTTHSPLTYIPIVAMARPVVPVQPTRLQSKDELRSEPNATRNHTQIYTLQPSSVISNRISPYPNVTVIQPNSIVSNCQPTISTVTNPCSTSYLNNQ